MKDKGKNGVKVEETSDAFPARSRKGKGCGPQASVAWYIMSGRSSQRSSVLCRCEYQPLLGSPGSAQHNTSGICTRILSFCWRGRCRSLSRSTSLHSCPCRGKSGYTPDQLSRGTLRRKRRKGQEVDFKEREKAYENRHRKYHLQCIRSFNIISPGIQYQAREMPMIR